MGNDTLLNIGAFSVLTGLSIAALRHYDDVALLEPAVVDPGSGYRRYRLDQVPDGRLQWTCRSTASGRSSRLTTLRSGRY